MNYKILLSNSKELLKKFANRSYDRAYFSGGSINISKLCKTVDVFSLDDERGHICGFLFKKAIDTFEIMKSETCMPTIYLCEFSSGYESVDFILDVHEKNKKCLKFFADCAYSISIDARNTKDLKIEIHTLQAPLEGSTKKKVKASPKKAAAKKAATNKKTVKKPVKKVVRKSRTTKGGSSNANKSVQK